MTAQNFLLFVFDAKLFEIDDQPTDGKSLTLKEIVAIGGTFDGGFAYCCSANFGLNGAGRCHFEDTIARS